MSSLRQNLIASGSESVFHRPSIGCLSRRLLFAVGLLAATSGWTMAEAPPSQSRKASEPVILTIKVGGQTAKLLISSLGGCLTLTQLFDEPSQPPSDRVQPPEDGVAPQTESDMRNDVSAEVAKEWKPEAPSQTAEVVAPIGSDEIRIELSEGSLSLALPAGHPEWVGRPLTQVGSDHLLSFATFPDITLEKSMQSLDETILREARKYIDEHILGVEGAAEQLTQIDSEWLKDNWLVKGKEFDAELKTSSAVYHRAWVEMKVSERDRRMVEHWWKDIVRHDRAKKLGGSMAVTVASIGLLHLLVGLVARRKSKRNAD